MSVWQPNRTSTAPGTLVGPAAASWSAAAPTRTDQREPGTYLRRPSLGRRLGGLTLVVALHAAFIYALVTGLGRQAIEVIRAPLVTRIIEAPPPPPPEAPPPPKLEEPPPPYIPPPDIRIESPPNSNAITATTPVKPAMPSAAPRVADREVSEQAISGPALVYPPDMVDRGIEGSADIECTVDVDGTTSDCLVDATIGNPSFGDEALRHAENSRFKPAIRNGKPIKAWHRWHVVFRLKN